MRTLALAFFFFSFLLSVSPPAAAAGAQPRKTEHPSNVALLEQPGRWVYVHFPSNLRLYVYGKDQPGKSACNVGCESAWPPLTPDEMDAKPVGDWTVIARANGKKQWAYKNQPVYLRFHDSMEKPIGDGIDGVWRFLEP
ncbi:MAG: hypothetical protein K2P94_00600 [Rhodospirillaceae bacterium]|nr:hypothetical protein [Rhodospirillaceae bacterium]